MAPRKMRGSPGLALLCLAVLGVSSWVFVGGQPAGLKMAAPKRLTSVPREAAADDLQQTLEKIKGNVMAGEFGTRGEAYVAAQLFILLCILVGTVPLVSSSLYVLAGPLAMATGGAMIAASLYELGGDLTPWITQPQGSSIKTGGIYEYARHPIYGGLVLLCFGIAIVSNSANRLILTGALYLLLDKKATLEEEKLMESDKSYSAYAEKTAGKLLPDVSEFLSKAD
mmetsp:Transcript_32432/g.61088  ORF Transcript_32432/g.61088 Transcript_32432/m.61088 type:complete len:226 (-) Transcript_32432:70-747(-)